MFWRPLGLLRLDAFQVKCYPYPWSRADYHSNLAQKTARQLLNLKEFKHQKYPWLLKVDLVAENTFLWLLLIWHYFDIDYCDTALKYILIWTLASSLTCPLKYIKIFSDIFLTEILTFPPTFLQNQHLFRHLSWHCSAWDFFCQRIYKNLTCPFCSMFNSHPACVLTYSDLSFGNTFFKTPGCDTPHENSPLQKPFKSRDLHPWGPNELTIHHQKPLLVSI